MKKLSMLLAAIMLVSVLAACGSKANDEASTPAPTTTPAASSDVAQGTLADGNYFAQEDKFEDSGWKYMVEIEVKDGKIANVNWTGANKDGGMDKKALDKAGKYGMKEKAKAQAEWYEQAEKVEKFLIEKQDVKAITFDDKGKTDAISGVSISVNAFAKLADQALAAGPVAKGPYKDGTYHAEQKAFDEKSGWKSTADVTIVNGQIVAANWNAVHKDGGDDKKKQSIDGKYGMKAGGASAEWHEQAALVEAELLAKQDPAKIAVKEDGKTDAISGVSIHVSDFMTLVQEALASAK
ncbi:FMN-binding protein [Paenibacillus albiflavus]|uniref:FMN-binding protein n=1 Tax=Paenibacillus albiflavus TaxID=2545760 RepID=A0A4R4EBM9_9BACL|nr:FMN-binding protein [Paenibacillus albiflavus]TCZ76350.1 FMN-binding protein [Paenibacillus albiflavus]